MKIATITVNLDVERKLFLTLRRQLKAKMGGILRKELRTTTRAAKLHTS